MTTGRRCRTPTGTRRRRPARAAPLAGSRCIRSSRTTRRGTGSTRAPGPAPPAPGTPRAATRRVGSSGASTSRRTPARASRSPSPTPATGRRRASASSWTTSRSPTEPARRSRPAWTAGRSPGHLPGSAPNANNFFRTDASGFPVGNAIATPHSLLLGFGLEGVSTEAERNAVMGRALDHLLD